MILLAARDLVKHYGPQPLLDGVSLELRTEERIGLVGPNGAGKTTLLRLLAGCEEPDRGTVERHPAARVDYLQQQPSLAPGRTLWEEAHDALAPLADMVHELERTAAELAAAADAAEHRRLAARLDFLQRDCDRLDAYHLDHRVERVLDGLGFARGSHAQPVEQLSGGQQNRLLLARLLLAGPDVMLLDEPSNHLDLEATEWLEAWLDETRQALVVVSHDRCFLDKVTGRTLELARGTVEDYPGNFSVYWRLKAERLEGQRRTYAKQQELIAKTEEFIRRNHYGPKSAQAEDRRKKLARIERAPPPREIAAPAMAFAAGPRTGDVALRAEGLAKAYAQPLFADLSFLVQRGQRWGILGNNGTGKTTLLRCLLGRVAPDAGQVSLGANVRVAYFDQMLTGLDDALPAVEAIRPVGREFPTQARRELLARFGLRDDLALKPVGSLSGGERSRAALARLAAAEGNLLVMDEPTNHLDLWALDALERALAAFEGTVLFVSHDRYFVNRLADHLLVFEPGRVRIVEGNYDTYLSMRRAEQESASNRPAKAVAVDGKGAHHPRKAARPARPKRRFPHRPAGDIEAEIASREQQIERLHHALAEPEALRSGDRVRAIRAQIAAHHAALAMLYEHWEEAVGTK